MENTLHMIKIIPILFSRKYANALSHQQCEFNLANKFWQLTTYWECLISWRIHVKKNDKKEILHRQSSSEISQKIIETEDNLTP